MTDEAPQDPTTEITAADRHPPVPEIAPADFHYPFGAEGAPTQLPSPADSAKLSSKKTYTYAMICAVFGILFGVVIAVYLGGFDHRAGPDDLGLVHSAADGLQGHLITNWDGKLAYRLTIAPGDPQQRVAFALAVTNSPRPVAFDFQTKDPLGFVLCTGNIVLKFDPTKAKALAATAQQFPGGQANAAPAAPDQAAQAVEVARLESQELDRERGKDIFQNDIGSDGGIESITAQGELPCDRKASERAVSWTFTSNFPTLAEQGQLGQASPEVLAAAASQASAAPQPSAARRSYKSKAPAPPVTYSIEGDDDIMEFDVARGIISTMTGKIYLIDKKSTEGLSPAWQDFPVRIHYVCNQVSGCTLMHAGAGVLHVRMSK
ncbi:MAG: hypothetical protein ABR956_00115 [Terracidiphilus sp.]|jgi:hypothetical protein